MGCNAGLIELPAKAESASSSTFCTEQGGAALFLQLLKMLGGQLGHTCAPTCALDRATIMSGLSHGP
eukprot:362298-Chlamydomonas_euryale.AAC.6